MSRDSRDREGAPEPTDVSSPTLRELGPRYDEKHHGLYVDILRDALERVNATAPRNIALTGHYGSGKSSVIQGLLTSIDSKKHAISISLSSLGITGSDDGEPDTSPDRSVTNQIQKEIVKQLLYREPPSRMRASRYHRIQPFRWTLALTWAIAGSAAVVALVKLVGRPQRLGSNWDLLLLAAGLVGAAVLLTQWRFRGRIWLEKLSAGPASISLTGSSNSYFDDYLDEIVYFFAVSKCRVVIFEDLDRFNDAYIFETLRGLNTILNSAKQLEADSPIRFIYAVRDSIFELLDAELSDGQPETMDGARLDLTRNAANQIDAPSTSRTKFFDLVVPMVPFITYRTSRDLIAKEMADSPHVPSGEVIKLVASHITDMRLIRNIRNEYEVFQTKVLPPTGLAGLSADKLFAMMVYKNLYLSDFEKIKTGDSRLDQVYNAYRELVNEQIAIRQLRIRQARRRLTASALTPERCQERGERLVEFLKLVYHFIGYSHYQLQQIQLRANGTAHTADKATDARFWRDVLVDPVRVEMVLPTGASKVLHQGELETILGTKLRPTDWMDNVRSSLRVEIDSIRDEVETLRRADLASILNRTDLTITVGEEELPLRDLADQVLRSTLVVDLLAAGYIDQNFALYVAQYYGVHVGPSAMNFILHVLQQDTQDFHYRFDSPSDIEALVEELGPDFLGEEGAYNVDIFDYLLSDGGNELIKPAIAKLSRGGAGDRLFLDAYISAGQHRAGLIRRLSPLWGEIFAYLVDASNVNPAEAPRWFSAALASASPDLEYNSSEAVRHAIENVADAMPAFTDTALDGGSAEVIAMVSASLGLEFPNLARMVSEVREQVVAWNAYRVNRANLTAALGSPNAGLSLDALAAADPGVQEHAIDRLEDYISVLREDPTLYSVEDPATFVSVLNALSDASHDHLREVLDRAAPECRVDDLRDVPESIWPAVIASQRCHVSISNVTAYLEVADDVDEDLGRLLADAGAVEDAESAADSDRNALAVRIANSEHVPLGRLEPLLVSLDSLVSAQSISRPIGPVVPDLVDAGVLADDQFAFVRIDSADWMTKERLINASEEFAEYLPHLDLSNEDLTNLFRSANVSPVVKTAVLEGRASLRDMSQTAANVVTAEALAEDLPVASSVLVALTGAGAQPELVLQLLVRQMDQMPIEDTFSVLGAMPEPYRSVPASTSTAPVTISADSRELFDRLAKSGHLQPPRKVRLKNLVQVARHSQ
ncbi:YobI family P-loop NTPase [Kribbella swartbergensis]